MRVIGRLRALVGRQGELGQFLLGGTAWAGGGLFAAVVLALLVNAIAARVLSDADLGAFLLLISLSFAVSVLAELGQPGLIAREIAGRYGDDHRKASAFIVRALLLVGLATAVIAGFVLAAGRPLADAIFGDPAITAAFPLLGLLVLARAGERVIGDIFRGQRNVREATFFGTVWTQLAAALALGGVLIVHGEVSGVTGVLVYALAAATVVLAGLLALRRRVQWRPVPRTGYAEHLSEGWPLIGHRGLTIVLQQAPLWVLAAAVGASESAPFGLAMRVVTAVSIPLMVVNQVVPPIVARLYRDGSLSQMERAVRTTATLAGLGAIALVVVFALFGQPLLTLAFGERYAHDAVPLLIILSVGQLGAVWAGSCAIVLLQVGRQRMLLMITAATVAVELVLAVIAADAAGPMGVAFVAAGAVIAQNALIVVAVYRRIGIRTDMSVPVLIHEIRRRR